MKKVTLVISAILVLALLILSGCSSAATTTTTTTTSAPPTSTTSTTTSAPTTSTTAPASTTATATTPADTSVVANVEPLELTMVTFLPDVPPGSDWAHAFRDNVDKFSGGKMKIKLMGPEAIPAPDAPAAAQRGTVDIADSMYTFASTLIKGLDSLARSEYSSPELRNTPAFKWVREASEKVGLYYLGAGVSSEAQVQTVIYTRKPISTLADLKGLKIGAAGGSNKAWIEGLGAVCVPVNFTDYYTSMERGTIDGYNIGIPGIQDFSLTPVTAAMVDEPVSSCGAGLFMNLDKYNKLTPTQKEVMDKASIQNEIDGAKMFTETVKKVKDDISKAGVKIIKLSPADSKAMYTAYQEGMWADDMKKWPELVPQLKEWILKADFPRKQ